MSVLNEFRQAIAIQQRKEDEDYGEQMRLPIDERVAKGITMTNLRVEFDFYDYPPQYCYPLPASQKYIRSARIFCQNNISKFKEGTTIIFGNEKISFKMEIIEDTVENFIIAPNRYDLSRSYLDFQNYNPNNWEINELKTSITYNLLSATANSLENDPRLDKIEKIFAGTLENNRISNFLYSNLNNSQNKAVERAINSQNFHLIQGPPGTGKTETIAHIAKVLVDAGLKVFVTAFTHTAINNSLNAISKKIKDASKVVKIGEKNQASEIIGNEYITKASNLPLEDYLGNSEFSQSGIVIGGTPYSMCYPASKKLNFWEFDVALIDEAAQMSIPLAVAVMAKSNKFIFVGDHKQLDPIIPLGTGLSMFTESIFSRLVRLYPNDKSLLTISYRLNEKLIRIPNALFYNNQLSSGVPMDFSNSTLVSQNYSEVLNHPDSKVLYLHKEFDSQGRSPYEANIVAELVSDLLDRVC